MRPVLLACVLGFVACQGSGESRPPAETADDELDDEFPDCESAPMRGVHDAAPTQECVTWNQGANEHEYEKARKKK